MKKTKTKIKKPDRFFKSFSGEYNGVSFEITRSKMDKREYVAQKNALGVKPKSKVEYLYCDDDIGGRFLDKKHYDNLIKNSEVLYDKKKEKYIRRN
ncbi:MAG: hypothetical protein FWE22_05660 [Firmicutes bacterium]|nr:hypothetical protein [Bacillota bacterium]